MPEVRLQCYGLCGRSSVGLDVVSLVIPLEWSLASLNGSSF